MYVYLYIPIPDLPYTPANTQLYYANMVVVTESEARKKGYRTHLFLNLLAHSTVTSCIVTTPLYHLKKLNSFQLSIVVALF